MARKHAPYLLLPEEDPSKDPSKPKEKEISTKDLLSRPKKKLPKRLKLF